MQTSDARLKQIVSNLVYGLREVLKLRLVSFQLKDQSDRRNYLGLLAQEIEPLIPEVVMRSTDPTTRLGMNYATLVPIVIKAIQEQQATIQEQQVALERKTAENKAQQQQSNELSARLAALEQMMQQLKAQAEKAQLPNR